MKIAVVTEDGKTISQHFGRAPYYVVLAVEDGQVTGRQQIEKPAHQHGHGAHQHGDAPEHHDPSAHGDVTHNQMLAPISDCDVLLARGMGYPAYQSLQQAGIRPIVTDVPEIDEAVRQYLAGGLVDHTERLH